MHRVKIEILNAELPELTLGEPGTDYDTDTHIIYRATLDEAKAAAVSILAPDQGRAAERLAYQGRSLDARDRELDALRAHITTLTGEVRTLKRARRWSPTEKQLAAAREALATAGIMTEPSGEPSRVGWLVRVMVEAIQAADPSPERKTPDEWQAEMPDVRIISRDGWAYGVGPFTSAQSWSEPITRVEYLQRRDQCTVEAATSRSEDDES